MGVLCFVLVLLCCTLCPFYFCNRLTGEEKSSGCFSLPLPHGVMAWSDVCDCVCVETSFEKMNY